jgi:hypothetical protein
MRLSHRHRNRQQARTPRVAISQAEITADLLYPAVPRREPLRAAAGRERER